VAAPLAVGLRMHGRRAVVIGGGDTAASAVSRLLGAGAEVLVVAPEVCTALAELADRRLVSLRQREYLAADIDAAWLVLACGPADVNARAAADADERRIWTTSGAEGSDPPAGQSSAELLPEPAGSIPGGRRVLVLGGARSGKSATAEAMLAGVPVVDYVATGQLAGAGDAEWDERVREHQTRRPAGWRTLETGAVADVLTSKDSAAPVLLDCLATWLAQAMDDSGLWSGTEDADARLAGRTDSLVAAWRATSRHVIAVSNEVGCGVVPATVSGRRFRDELGWLNSRIAAVSEEVWFCTAGIPRRLR
jgi:adenosylcobinamide kinase / adenosylcobinamide-phosphate guanylyltransferase